MPHRTLPAMDDIWNRVHAERQALIADLAAIAPAEWEKPSLAEGWTIHDVAAHLVDNARTTAPRLLLAMARARFDFDRQNANGVAREKGASPEVTLERLREVASRRSGPPAPKASRLVEEIAHGEDIRRPLGLHRDYPVAWVLDALGYQVCTPQRMGGAQETLREVRFTATDADFSAGDGPAVEGPALDLLMVATGRPPRAGRLSGPGIARLQQIGRPV